MTVDEPANEGGAVSLTTVSIESKLWTNDDDAPINQPLEGESGLIEVEISDANEIAVHFRHYADTGACLSAYTTRAGALALAEVLRAAVASET